MARQLDLFPNELPSSAERARPVRARLGTSELPPPQLRFPFAPGTLHVVEGGEAGTGHRRGRLVALPGREATPLPSRAELTEAILGALADLVGGRISPTAGAAIRDAAEEALRRLDAVELDPHRLPEFVRAARALEELTRTPRPAGGDA